jgi:PAS domain S-box-containing protein
VHPADRARVHAAIERALDPRGPGRLDEEYRIHHRVRGEERWIRSTGQLTSDARGRLRRFAGVVRDVTEDRRAASARRALEERFRLFFENAGVGMVQADARSGRIVAANRKMCELTGYAPEELLGRPMQDLVLSEDGAEDSGRFMRIDRGGNYAAEKRYVRRDGRVIWVEVTATVVYEPDGTPRTIAIVHDISHRKALEQGKDRLVAVLGHDLRNPLSAIVMGAAVLPRPGDPRRRAAAGRRAAPHPPGGGAARRSLRPRRRGDRGRLPGPPRGDRPALRRARGPR